MRSIVVWSTKTIILATAPRSQAPPPQRLPLPLAPGEEDAAADDDPGPDERRAGGESPNTNQPETIIHSSCV